MKQVVLFTIAFLALVSCNDSKHKTENVTTDQTVIDEMVNIDEICDIEEIIADSTLENAAGDPSWRKVGSGMIRVRRNGKFYLRMETDSGTVTDVTYQYDR